MEEKALKGFSWTFLGLGVNKILAAVTTVVLAALVSPSEFGLMTVGSILINFVSWFGGSSFGATLIVHQELDRRGQGTVLSLSLLGGAGAAVGVLALTPSIADALHQPRLTGVLSVLCVSILLTGASAFYEASLQNQLEFKRRFFAQSTQTISFSVVSIGLAAAGAGVWSLVVGQVSSVALFTVALIVFSPQRLGPAWDRAQAGRLFRTGRGFALQGLTQFIRQNADTVSVGRSFSAASIGFYAMAFRLGDLTYSALADPIARVTFPAFARSLARDEDVRPVFLRVLQVVALVALPAGMLLSACADPLTRTFFAADWAPMIGVLNIAGVWAALRPVESTISWLLNSLGRAGAVGRVAIFVLLPLFAGLALALSTHDLRIVALVPLGDLLIAIVILVTLVNRFAQVTPRMLGRALAPTLAAGGLCWVAARIVATALHGTAGPLALLASAAAGLLVYGAAIAGGDRDLVRALAAQAARLRGRGDGADGSPSARAGGAAPGAPIVRLRVREVPAATPDTARGRGA